MTNANFKFFSEKMGGIPANTYIGQFCEVFYDPSVGNLRLGDGATPGGIPTYESSDIITSHIYVDPKRTDTYTATGSREFPFKTLQEEIKINKILLRHKSFMYFSEKK